MKVLGVQVTEAQESACIEFMKSKQFTAGEIIEVANKAQFPYPMRLADRIIQRERRAGNITLSGGQGRARWTWKQ